MQSLRNGERGAYHAVYERFIAQLNYFAMSITGDSMAAEDIASESLLKVFNRKEEFATLSDLKNYLFRVASNESLNYVKMQQRYRNHLGRWQEGQTLHAADVHVKLIEAEAVDAIFRHLDELPQQIREVVRLSLFEGLTLDEIAREMNIAYKSVRNYKSKGLAILRDRLSLSGDLDAVLLAVALNILQSHF